MRDPPMCWGLTTRSAPDRSSFSSLAALRARVTMKRSGFRARALRVMNELAASPSTAATSAAACSMPASSQHGVVGGIAEHGRVVTAGQPVGVLVDDDERPAGGRHLVHDRPTHPAEPADDHVVGQRGDVPFHSASPEEVVESALDEGLDEHAEAVQRRADPDEDEDDGEDDPGGREGLDLLEPDRRDRGDRLVHGVERSEAQDDVADRATDENADQQEDGKFQPAPVAHEMKLTSFADDATKSRRTMLQPIARPA